MAKHIPAKDMIGTRYGRLTVIDLIDVSENKYGQSQPIFSCLCDCGNRIQAKKVSLRRSKKPTRSCGCLHIDTASAQGKSNATHGLSKIRMHTVWQRIISRCEDGNNPAFHRYGGRGDNYLPSVEK